MTRLLPTARKATESKQWNNLYFVLTKNDGSVLELGTGATGITQTCKYSIVKDNKLFDSLLSFDAIEEERRIPIEVYINELQDVYDFQNFFEPVRYNQNYKYNLEVYADNQKYNATVITENKPYEVTKIEDLYGTSSQPTSTIKLELIMENPFFYSNFTYDYEIGAVQISKKQFPLSIRLGDIKKYDVSEMRSLIPHIIDNAGNEENGIIITIISGKHLLNPRIINRTTDFTMRFNLETFLNDKIVINTIDKRVFVNDEEVFNTKLLFDKWMTLIKGTNILRFDADLGEEFCKVQVQFFKKYRAIGVVLNEIK